MLWMLQGLVCHLCALLCKPVNATHWDIALLLRCIRLLLRSLLLGVGCGSGHLPFLGPLMLPTTPKSEGFVICPVPCMLCSDSAASLLAPSALKTNRHYRPSKE